MRFVPVGRRPEWSIRQGQRQTGFADFSVTWAANGVLYISCAPPPNTMEGNASLFLNAPRKNPSPAGRKRGCHTSGQVRTGAICACGPVPWRYPASSEVKLCWACRPGVCSAGSFSVRPWCSLTFLTLPADADLSAGEQAEGLPSGDRGDVMSRRAEARGCRQARANCLSAAPFRYLPRTKPAQEARRATANEI